MSMTLYLVKVPLTLAARIRLDPSLLEQLWGWEEVETEQDDRRGADPAIAAIDRARDTLSEDYLSISREVHEGSTEYPWMSKVLGGTGSEIGFDGGYDNAYIVGPQEVAAIADGLVEEGWWEVGRQVVSVPQALAAFYRAAAHEDRYVIGVVA